LCRHHIWTPCVGRAIIAAALIFLTTGACTQETLKVTAAQRGVWDSTVAELDQQDGIFKQYDLLLVHPAQREVQQAQKRPANEFSRHRPVGRVVRVTRTPAVSSCTCIGLDGW
jgi:hypothetical protein